IVRLLSRLFHSSALPPPSDFNLPSGLLGSNLNCMDVFFVMWFSRIALGDSELTPDASPDAFPKRKLGRPTISLKCAGGSSYRDEPGSDPASPFTQHPLGNLPELFSSFIITFASI